MINVFGRSPIQVPFAEMGKISVCMQLVFAAVDLSEVIKEVSCKK